MNGLDKITERILAEAQAEADKILSEAQAECDRISADYAARAEQIRSTLTEEAMRDAREYIMRAKSTAATNKRNLLLQTRGALLDEVFASTLEQIHGMEAEKYAEILVGLLCAAFTEQLEAERLALRLSSEDESVEPESYEVVMNLRDRDRIGVSVLAAAKKRLSAKADPAKLNKLVLSSKTAGIDGGLILRCGDVETNCSLSLIFAELREKLEAEVGRALFEVKNKI
jgi:V/A-type H+-transporting ATPase subunit E